MQINSKLTLTLYGYSLKYRSSVSQQATVQESYLESFRLSKPSLSWLTPQDETPKQTTNNNMTKNLVQPLFNMGPIRSLKKTMTPFSLLSLGFKGFSLSMPPAQNTLYKKPLDSMEMEENITIQSMRILVTLHESKTIVFISAKYYKHLTYVLASDFIIQIVITLQI